MAAILGVGQVVSRGHTRPLTEISFVPDPGVEKTILVSSAHDKLPQIRDGESGDWIGSFEGHKGAVWSCQVDAATRTLCERCKNIGFIHLRRMVACRVTIRR